MDHKNLSRYFNRINNLYLILFILLNSLLIKKSWNGHADSQQNQQYPDHFFYRVVEYKIGNPRFHKPADTPYQYGADCCQKSE